MDQSYEINNILFWKLCFLNFGRKKSEHLSFKKGYFSTMCGHIFGIHIYFFHKTEIQTVILRCLVCLNTNWIKSYDVIFGKKSFFSCVKMHHFRGKIPKYISFDTSEENQPSYFQNGYFFKILWWCHDPYNQEKCR